MTFSMGSFCVFESRVEGIVAKWLSRRAHNPKVRGSKPRYALFFFHRDSMAEWIRRLTTNQEIPGSSPGRVNKKFFGSTEFQSLNLSLAKRALCRLSYTPVHIQQKRFRTLRAPS